ncbi:replication-relaxation family protein [Streptomyces smyrnaeus]|uniref:replication-relaxation family protein n=1 Tax=Streptomyces smyrnaeus TaxID=1387713 RepID=UPI000C19C300
METLTAPPRDTIPVRDLLLGCLYRHRAADTAQLHAMVGAHRYLPYVRRCLRQLRDEGLVEAAVEARHFNVWALTRRGISVVSAWPEMTGGPRVARVSPDGMHRAHALAVTRTALAFLEDARARGDEFSPLDWQPEVMHPLRDGAVDGARNLIADAVMRYTQAAPTRSLLRAFIEVDRATESPERLAGKLITYARYHDSRPASRLGGGGTPQWQRTYPLFPRVLFVLTNAGPRALRQRTTDLKAMARQHPLVRGFAERVPTGVAVLEELEEAGASSPVWTPLLDDSGSSRGWMEL